MAKSHTTNGLYTNPEVRFERTDIAMGTVLQFGVGLVVLVAASIWSMWWLYGAINRQESKSKESDLPPAFVDADRQPPEPRLEGIEDIRAKNVKLMPSRARDYLAAQEKILADGDEKAGVLAIGKAIDQLAGKLPHRKGNKGGQR